MTPRVLGRPRLERSVGAATSTALSRSTSRWSRPSSLPRGEALALALLAVITVAFEWDRLTGPSWIGMDTATAFYPWYTFLSEQLRAGHIPAWNPYQFSGAPFAADPESGWMYLPAMLAFTLLPLEAAIRAHLLFHVALAAFSTYALARSLGLDSFGSLLAATIYSHSGFFEGHNVCCYAYADVAAWLPLLLLGAELAMRTSTLPRRAFWWGIGGLALSQILAAWIGQGAYYAVLVFASFITFRALVTHHATIRSRLRRLGLNAVGILTFGAALAAAGLLPRLEYNLVSNLPGGYPDADVSLRATSLLDWGLRDGWDRLLLQPGFEYIGWPVLMLSIAAPLLSWRRACVWYFAILGVAVLILARAEPTPLHAALSLLPGFEHIHARSPERALLVFYVAPALLAGASVTALSRLLTRPRLAHWLGVVILAVVALDLHNAGTIQSAQSLAGGGDYQFQRVDLAAYYASTPATDFLESTSNASEPFRYLGYAGHVFGGPMPYTLRWADPSIVALQVNNRGLVTHLHDVQGYNPLHIARYDDFITALNGHRQNYHHADVFDTGLDSSLLDVLNVRYILFPAHLASDEAAPKLHRTLNAVFEDDRVQVFENPSALPRAWIVHAARQVASEAVAASLTADAIDLRSTAILESPPPPLGNPVDPSAESVQFLRYDPDVLVLEARAGAAGLLVLSETYYPAWHAYLDGQPTAIFPVDRALRGVALPAGDHLVEFRYESAALSIGLGITVLAAVLLVGLAILPVAAKQSDGSGEVRCKTGAVPQL